jgi:hypothetical protein
VTTTTADPAGYAARDADLAAAYLAAVPILRTAVELCELAAENDGGLYGAADLLGIDDHCHRFAAVMAACRAMDARDPPTAR